MSAEIRTEIKPNVQTALGIEPHPSNPAQDSFVQLHILVDSYQNMRDKPGSNLAEQVHDFHPRVRMLVPEPPNAERPNFERRPSASALQVPVYIAGYAPHRRLEML